MNRFLVIISALLCLTTVGSVGLLLCTIFGSSHETKAHFKFMAEHRRQDLRYFQEMERLTGRLLKDMDKNTEATNRYTLIIGCATVLQVLVAIVLVRRPRLPAPPRS